MSKMPKQNRFASKVDFRTPQNVFDGAGDLFDVVFHLDVAASKENRLCNWYFTEEIDALQQQWWGHVWCNPPYNDIGPWIDHGLKMLREGNVLSLTYLVPASTCTKWFKRAWDAAEQVVFISGRLKFEGPHVVEGSKGNATNPSVLIHIRPFARGVIERKVRLVGRDDL